MHEMSLLNNLMHKIEQLASDNESDHVSAVHVKIGALAHISATHFREHFTYASQGSVAEGAVLHIDVSDDQSDSEAQNILLRSIDIIAQEEG